MREAKTKGRRSLTKQFEVLSLGGSWQHTYSMLAAVARSLGKERQQDLNDVTPSLKVGRLQITLHSLVALSCPGFM